MLGTVAKKRKSLYSKCYVSMSLQYQFCSDTVLRLYYKKTIDVTKWSKLHSAKVSHTRPRQSPLPARCTWDTHPRQMSPFVAKTETAVINASTAVIKTQSPLAMARKSIVESELVNIESRTVTTGKKIAKYT